MNINRDVSQTSIRAELSMIEKCFGRIPLPKGEGAAERRVRGEESKASPLTRRPSGDGRHPLPSGEGFAKNKPLNLRID